MNNARTPLAERMRPETLEAFFGQDELVGEASFLRKLTLVSIIEGLILLRFSISQIHAEQ